VSTEDGLDRLAASLRVDAGDLPHLVEVLAGRLEVLLPGAVTVERRSTGLFSRQQVLHRVVVDLGGDEFVLTRGGGGFRATRRREVRGIVIRNEERTLGEWVADLHAALAEAAATSAAARRALAALEEP
jgi:hypothetical protein